MGAAKSQIIHKHFRLDALKLKRAQKLMKASTETVAASLIVATTVTAAAQQSPHLAKKAQAVKHKVDSLVPHSRISVIPVHGDEEFGEFLSHDQDGFVFRDVDRNADVTLRYSEVRKVKIGYGGYNSATGRHTDHTKAIVITAVVLGALGALIGAAAAAKN